MTTRTPTAELAHKAGLIWEIDGGLNGLENFRILVEREAMKKAAEICGEMEIGYSPKDCQSVILNNIPPL